MRNLNMLSRANTRIRQSRFAIVALIILAGLSLQAIVPLSVSAAQLSTRSITMSDSAPSTAGASYKITFTPATTTQELIVDFCSDTPFVGSTCAFASTTVPTVTGVTSSLGTATTVGSGSPVHTVKVTGLTMTAATAYTITLSGLTNPSTNTTFYARILTYATGNASGYAPANTTGGSTTTGTYVDYGGIALSTAAPITVTAKVQETLAFCVYIATCGDTPSITLGHGANTTLDNTAVDTATVTFSLSTNDKSGTSVNLKGATLTSGANTIPAVNAGGSAATIVAGTAAFGMKITSAGSMTATTNYAGTGGTYGYNTATTGTYGDPIATSSGPVNANVTVLTFGATASSTTPAGIYTTTDQLIATGTF